MRLCGRALRNGYWRSCHRRSVPHSTRCRSYNPRYSSAMSLNALSRVRACCNSILAVAAHSSMMTAVTTDLREILAIVETTDRPATAGEIQMLAQSVADWFAEHTTIEPFAFIVKEAMPLAMAAKELLKFSTLASQDSSSDFLVDLEEVRQLNTAEQAKVQSMAARGKQFGECVFVGHGHSKVHFEVLSYLGEDWNKRPVKSFESYKRAGGQIISVLEQALTEADLAVMIATAEDVAGERLRARQNVVHEIGLFQGRLGFERVAILQEEGIEWFSNSDGLLVVPFSKGTISETYVGLRSFFDKFQ